MSRFDVPEMSCGHCSAAIEQAVKAIDPTARVACDLAGRRVEIDSVLTDDALSDAIRNAGYDSVARPAA